MKFLYVLVALIPFVYSSTIEESEFYLGPEGLTRYLLNRFPTGNFKIGNRNIKAPKEDSDTVLCRQMFGDHSTICVKQKSTKVDVTFNADASSRTHVVDESHNKSFTVGSTLADKGRIIFVSKVSGQQEYVGCLFNLSETEKTTTTKTWVVNKHLSGGSAISFRSGHKLQMGEEEVEAFFNDNEIDDNNVIRAIAGSKVTKFISVGNSTFTIAKYSRAVATIIKTKGNERRGGQLARIRIRGNVITKVSSTGGTNPTSIIAESTHKDTIVVRRARQ